MTKELPEVISAIQTDFSQNLAHLATLKVTSPETQTECINFLGEIKARLKRIEALRKEFTGDLNIQIKKINNTFKAQSEPLEQLEEKLKVSLKSYMDYQDKLAREAAEKLRLEQEAKEEEERKARFEAERKAAEEERLRKQAEQAKSESERRRLEALAEAARKESEAKNKEAEAIKTEAESVLPVEAPQKSVRSEGGLATRSLIWKWEVEDLGLVMRSHPELIQPNDKAINDLIRTGTRSIAGLRIYQESQISIR